MRATRAQVSRAARRRGVRHVSAGEHAGAGRSPGNPRVDVARAVEAGATVREAPSDFISGDRFASIRDPFGVRWSVMTRIEDLSEEESAARVAEWAAQQG